MASRSPRDDEEAPNLELDSGDGSIAGEENAGQKQKKPRAFLQRADRDLTEEEVRHPAVQRFLMDEVEQLETENARLKIVEGRFYEADKENAVFRSQNTQKIALEASSTALVAIGSVLIGLGFQDGAIDRFGVIGVVALCVGLVSRYMKK